MAFNFSEQKRKSFKEQSDAAIDVFKQTVNSLAAVNRQIMERSAKLREDIMALELERDEIMDISIENTKIMKNIDKILE